MRVFHIKAIIAMLLLSHGLAKAQETVSPTGADISGAGGTTSYTVGQIAFQTFTGAPGSVAGGVQQPYEISVVLGMDVPGISLDAFVYPNPTMDHLKLVVGDQQPLNLSYRLYDLYGRTIRENEISEAVTAFDLTELPAATYLLAVTQSEKPIKTFKIIKK